MSRAGVVLDAMRSLPLGGLHDILGDGIPVVLAPHPDDEVLGCGALLMAAVEENRQPLIVFVTDGSGSHPGSVKFPRAVLIAQRQREAREAARIMGIAPERLHFLGVRDTSAPRRGPEMEAVAASILALAARERHPVLLAPWRLDPHGDHQAVHGMAGMVAQQSGWRHLSYPVWGWTLPAREELGEVQVEGWRFPVGRERSRKMEALYAHASQWTDLIDDDPDGFRLDEETIRAMVSGDEVYLVNP